MHTFWFAEKVKLGEIQYIASQHCFTGRKSPSVLRGCLFHNYSAVSDETPQSTIIYHCEKNVFLKNGLERLDSVRSDSRSTINLSAPFLIVYLSIFSAESQQLSYALK
ncbi:hypothetical protein T07_685 [Trichinella nelsoni]|uniref:Uncharacterized protein n=1 Tax=Trichinella nelsoni TaxID=6336 RepID=A0A0V0RM29_9BILA|nr:hypothetical protein T07_685 [Trichinella nelsoni]